MSKIFSRFHRSALSELTLLIAVILALSSSVRAGDHQVRKLVPIYAQQTPTAVVYSAPLVYATQAPATYVLQAPALYSIPTTAVYAASVATQVPYASAAIGNVAVGVAGSRLKAVDREDIIEELRKTYKEVGADRSRRERRKALRDSAKTKFGEMIGGVTALNEGELQDIENIVSSIIDVHLPQAVQAPAPPTTTPYSSTAPVAYSPIAPVAYSPSLVPSFNPPALSVQLYQPVVPVQLWVPVQPKHRLLHH